ncbi:PspA/IM30 family protein [Sphingomonas rubra]|uniref:Phage shock protein A (PspA) family protein n=1 Tax=Sphingomonas rubra TaxID=634430 RepID=A0A1I5QYJ4_9SPHN|nr:PspA/IM30 family protein [Sphingomonas rubra]SFP51348.1 phage shock protein A (PspA) family protein [Sphingomonas rubra]
MSMWNQLVTLLRGSAHEAGQSVVDKRALVILDQQIRDAQAAQGKARDDLATLTARRRLIEKDLDALTAQRGKYEASARAAMQRGDMDLAREVAERLASIESEQATKTPQIADMRGAEDRIRGIIKQSDGKIQALAREVEVVRANESVQKAQASVAASYGGTISSMGSAADSLKRIKEQQAIRDEKFRASAELEDMRTGADLDAKLRSAGLLEGSSSADDILRRLSGPQDGGEATRLPGAEPRALPRE